MYPIVSSSVVVVLVMTVVGLIAVSMCLAQYIIYKLTVVVSSIMVVTMVVITSVSTDASEVEIDVLGTVWVLVTIGVVT